MATDKTEPPIKTILTVAAISIGTLVGLRFAFVSYFNSMYEAEQHRVVLDVSSPILARVRDDAEQKLSQGRPLAINQAVQQFASARPAAVAPRPSTDMAALQGWSQLPLEVPVAPPPTQPVQAADLPGSPLVVPAPAAAVAPAPTGAVAPAPAAAVAPAAVAHPAAPAAVAHPAAPAPVGAH